MSFLAEAHTQDRKMSYAHAEHRRSSSSSHERFPDLQHSVSGDYLSVQDEHEDAATNLRSLSPIKSTRPDHALHEDRWRARKENHLSWGNGHLNVAGPRSHSRQKSLTDAFRTIRSRKASVSENAQEIAEALKAPVSVKIVVCAFF